MREQKVMAIEISVQPQLQGNDVECDITGQDVVDDAIRLPKEGTFEIGFNLDPTGAWSWNESDPFCARPAKCPPVGSPQHGLLSVTGTPTAKRFTVEARPTGSARIFHYRLNFANGKTCDPIVIRD